jgi:hypothetical protein
MNASPSGPDLAGPNNPDPKPASYDLQWNNPKIHTTDRRKHWLACDDHRDSLAQFLSARGFLKEVLAL